MNGFHRYERNSFFEKKKFYISNWPFVNRKNLRFLRLYHKGIVKFEIDNEFVLTPSTRWFYIMKYFYSFKKMYPSSRIIGYDNGIICKYLEVIEKTGRTNLYERKSK